MKNFAWIFMVTTMLAACQQDNKAVVAKLDQMAKDIAELKAMAATGAGRPQQLPPQKKRRPEPDPKDVYAVPIAGDPVVGPPDALVTIVKGYEYACPWCEKARKTIDDVVAAYPGKVRVVSKQFIVHDMALGASLGACAAHKQGKFAEFDKLLWEKAYPANRDFSDARLDALASEAGLDLARFQADRAGAECKAFVEKDQAELRAVGQGSTPTFYVNGRYLVGATAAFKATIDEELAKAEQRVAAGTAPADYYQTWVIGKGLAKFAPKPLPTPTP